MNRNPYSRSYADLIYLLKEAQDNPHDAGISTKSQSRPTDSMKWAVSEIKQWFLKENSTESQGIDYWGELVNEAVARLKDLKNQERTTKRHFKDEKEVSHFRIKRAVPIALLSAIHVRIDKCRRRKNSSHGADENDDTDELIYFYRKAEGLIKNIEDALEEYGY
ncbi:MAG: hypothetical protein AAF944_01050 [Bacteroidota bacterium]